MGLKEKLEKATEYALANQPKVGSFPFLAECLRQAGVKHNIWSLPAVQAMYLMDDGKYVVNQGAPLMTGVMEVPVFDEQAVVEALHTNQIRRETVPFQNFYMHYGKLVCGGMTFTLRSVK